MRHLRPLPEWAIDNNLMCQRIWDRIDYKSIPGCHIWTGACAGSSLSNKGKPSISIEGRVYHVSRIVYFWEHKIDPFPYLVLHNCFPNPDNPHCINPAHLRLGDNSDNQLEKYRKGYIHIPSTKKFNDSQIKDIRLAHANGERVYILAQKYGVSPSTISAVIHYYNYKDVD